MRMLAVEVIEMTDRLARIGRLTVPLKLAALVGFLGTMFIGWHTVSVEIAGVVDVEETSNGWHGWGLVAGVVALVLLALTLAESSRGLPTVRNPTVALLPLTLLIATALAVFTGEVNVTVAGVGVEVQETLWAGWLALGFAAIVAAAYAAELVARIPHDRPSGIASVPHA